MSSGARSPEELETLLEDAFVVRDGVAFADLFEERAVLAEAGGAEARGVEEIADMAGALWSGRHAYLGDPRRVVQARDTALVIAQRGINVARRGSAGWRYAISLLYMTNPNQEER